jgi:hypothetical protein
MRLFAILLVVLSAGLSWAMWQGIDWATAWLVEAEVPAPDRPVLDELNEVESTSAEQGLASPGSASEMNETIVASADLAPAQDGMADAPTEADTRLAVSSDTPARDTALPEPRGDAGVAEPLISAPTVQEPEMEAASAGAAAPDPTTRFAATAPAAEAASEFTSPEPDLSVAAEPLISAPTVPEPAPEAASAEPEPSALGPAVELSAPDPAAADAPADEPSQWVQAEAPQCNIDACAAAYQSFRASDCTYQPFEGPRRLCTQGPQATEPLEAEAATAATQPVQAEVLQCNVERCTTAFRSFRASDCTYQPFEGPRQLCPY